MSSQQIIKFILNECAISVEINTNILLLDWLRRERKLTGTKEGCREGDCGACMVLRGSPAPSGIDYRTVNSCMLPLFDCAHTHIVTIEGLNSTGLSRVQQLMIEEGAFQCGFCTPGFIISITGFLFQTRQFHANELIEFLSGNLCRCTGYKAIERMAERLCKALGGLSTAAESQQQRLEYLVDANIIPAYFRDIPNQLGQTAPNSTILLPLASKTIIIGGGTDLLVQHGENIDDLHLCPARQLPGLLIIKKDPHTIRLGAALTVAELSESNIMQQIIPEWHEYVQLISCPSIRHRATLAGNIVNASPIGDLSIIFLALNADMVLSGENYERKVSLKNFFLEYKKMDLNTGEILKAIEIIQPIKNFKFHFEKVARRQRLDIASVNCAMSVVWSTEDRHIVEIHAAAGGVAPIPLYLHNFTAYLKQREINESAFNRAVSIALEEVSPISDVRGSSDYKRLLLRQLLWAHAIKLLNINLQPGSLL